MQISDRNLRRYIEKYGLLSDIQMAEAELELQRHAARPPALVDLLLNWGYLREKDLLNIYAEEINVQTVDLEALSPEPDVVLLIPEEVALSRNCLALERNESQIQVAMADPNDVYTLDFLQKHTGLIPQPLLAFPGSYCQKAFRIS